MVPPVPAVVSEGPAALRDQVHAVHESAFAWAVSCCHGRRDEAEEALQEAYARVISGKARFHGRSSFKTWLFGVIRMTAREQRRRGVLRRIGLSRAQHHPRKSTPPAADQLVAERDRARVLAEAMSRLPERQREVLHLAFYEGLTVTEAALAMGVSVGTARTHYHRGKQSLRATLDNEG